MQTTAQLPSAIFAYVHHNRSLAALVTVRCQTDFAIRTNLLHGFGQKLAMHVAAAGDAQLDRPWIFEASKTVKDAIAEVAAALRERVVVTEVHVQS